jgi:hypothetical protein
MKNRLFEFDQDECAGFGREGTLTGIGVGEPCENMATHWDIFPLCDDCYNALRRFNRSLRRKRDEDE